MSKYTYRFMLLLVALMLLAACGPAVPAGTTPAAPDEVAPAETLAVPGTGVEAAVQCASQESQELTAAGQQAYEAGCASCHGAQGEGVGDFPALAGNSLVTGGDVVQLVQNYFAVEGHPKNVTAEELASLFSYARSAFGNMGEVVCPEEIQIPVTQ